MFRTGHSPAVKKDGNHDKIPTFTPDELAPMDANNAEYHAQSLYQTGANIINSGNAYAAKSMEDRTAMSKTLQRVYHEIPKYVAKNGRHTADNPLHALFVMKVALDHTEPREIALLYHRLKYAYSLKKIDIHPLHFPGKCSMLGEQAMLDVLQGYILSHLQKFMFLTHADIAAIQDKFIPHADYFFIVGDNTKDKEMSFKVAFMFNDTSYTMTAHSDNEPAVRPLTRTK